jgi:hypothetical protein
VFLLAHVALWAGYVQRAAHFAPTAWRLSAKRITSDTDMELSGRPILTICAFTVARFLRSSLLSRMCDESLFMISIETRGTHIVKLMQLQLDTLWIVAYCSRRGEGWVQN